MWFSAGIANILGDNQRQQILALGRLGWPVRRIEQATGVRREAMSAYLKAAGIAIQAPAGAGRRQNRPVTCPPIWQNRPVRCPPTLT